MLKARFPNGLTLVFNEAYFLRHGSDAWKLYTDDPDKGGQWVASFQPSSGVVIENFPACKTYFVQPAESTNDLRKELISIHRKLRDIAPRKIMKR